jgi:hypothetical protein
MGFLSQMLAMLERNPEALLAVEPVMEELRPGVLTLVVGGREEVEGAVGAEVVGVEAVVLVQRR